MQCGRRSSRKQPATVAPVARQVLNAMNNKGRSRLQRRLQRIGWQLRTVEHRVCQCIIAVSQLMEVDLTALCVGALGALHYLDDDGTLGTIRLEPHLLVIGHRARIARVHPPVGQLRHDRATEELVREVHSRQEILKACGAALGIGGPTNDDNEGLRAQFQRGTRTMVSSLETL